MGVILGLYRGYIGIMEKQLETTKSSHCGKVRGSAAGNGKWNTARSQPFFKMLAPPQSDDMVSGWNIWMGVGVCGMLAFMLLHLSYSLNSLKGIIWRII